MSLGPTPETGQRPGSVRQTKETVPVAKMPSKSEGIPTKGITGGSAENDKLFDVFEEVPVNPQKKKKPANKGPSEMEILQNDVARLQTELKQTQKLFFGFAKMMEKAMPEILKSMTPQKPAAPAVPMPNPAAMPQGGMML